MKAYRCGGEITIRVIKDQQSVNLGIVGQFLSRSKPDVHDCVVGFAGGKLFHTYGPCLESGLNT